MTAKLLNCPCGIVFPSLATRNVATLIRFRVVCFIILLGCWLSYEAPRLRADEATASPTTADGAAWHPLFDGSTLSGWKEINYGSPASAAVVDGTIELDFGAPLAGIQYTGDSLPSGDYELQLEAQRLEGTDFFCGLTFPVAGSHCSLILGGWGGSLVGLSNIDDEDASDNETRTTMGFRSKQWYRIRLEVTDKQIQAWEDDTQVVNQDIENRKISVRSEVQRSRPLGISAFETRAAYRKLQWRALPLTSARD